MAVKKRFSEPLVVILLSIIIVLLITIITTLLLRNGKPINNQNQVKEAITKAETGKLCQWGRSQKSDFLETYVVKKGDTLLSISRNKLKDVSRVNEIIELNKDRYPSLSMEKPFLEQGWKLYLPPQYTVKTSGMISEIKGEIKTVRLNDGAWEIGNSDQPGHFAALYVDKNTEMFSGVTPKVGDCIKSLVDEKTGEVFSVSLQ